VRCDESGLTMVVDLARAPSCAACRPGRCCCNPQWDYTLSPSYYVQEVEPPASRCRGGEPGAAGASPRYLRELFSPLARNRREGPGRGLEAFLAAGRALGGGPSLRPASDAGRPRGLHRRVARLGAAREARVRHFRRRLEVPRGVVCWSPEGLASPACATDSVYRPEPFAPLAVRPWTGRSDARTWRPRRGSSPAHASTAPIGRGLMAIPSARKHLLADAMRYDPGIDPGPGPAAPVRRQPARCSESQRRSGRCDTWSRPRRP
jgi:hypothetical protein